MGGVIHAVSNFVSDAVDVVKNIVNVAEVAVKSSFNTIVDSTKLTLDLGKDILKGNNPLNTINQYINYELNNITDVVRATYKDILDPYFGIDNTKFLGMKGWIGDTLGSGTKDLLYDHAKTTVMIGALVATLAVAWAYAPVLSEYFASEVALYAHTTFAITNATALISIYEGTAFIASLGISYLLSGAISGIVGSAFSPLAYLPMVDAYLLKNSALALNNLKDSISGVNFEKMAGGVFYNEVYSGGKLYSYSQDNSLNSSVGGEITLSNNTKLNQVPYIDFAGDSYIDKINLTLLT